MRSKLLSFILCPIILALSLTGCADQLSKLDPGTQANINKVEDVVTSVLISVLTNLVGGLASHSEKSIKHEALVQARKQLPGSSDAEIKAAIDKKYPEAVAKVSKGAP